MKMLGWEDVIAVCEGLRLHTGARGVCAHYYTAQTDQMLHWGSKVQAKHFHGKAITSRFTRGGRGEGGRRRGTVVTRRAFREMKTGTMLWISSAPVCRKYRRVFLRSHSSQSTPRKPRHQLKISPATQKETQNEKRKCFCFSFVESVYSRPKVCHTPLAGPINTIAETRIAIGVTLLITKEKCICLAAQVPFGEEFFIAPSWIVHQGVTRCFPPPHPKGIHWRIMTVL